MYTLYALLLDPKTQIRDTAAKSLGDLLPGLYTGKVSHEILESLDINELLDLLLPPPFPGHVKRILIKLGFDLVLLEQYLVSPDASLVEAFIQNTLRGTTDGMKSLLTLLCRRMPQIETYLDTTIQQEADPARKRHLHHTLETIHNEFKVPISNGFELYL